MSSTYERFGMRFIALIVLFTQLHHRRELAALSIREQFASLKLIRALKDSGILGERDKINSELNATRRKIHTCTRQINKMARKAEE